MMIGSRGPQMTYHRAPLSKLVLVPALAALAVAASFSSSTVLASTVLASAHSRARVARTLNVTDTTHLHFVREEANSILLEQGVATGGLPGKVTAHLDVGARVKASFTISTRSGSLIGQGSGVLHSSGEYSSFGGSMTVTRGTGRYAHAHGHGGFYGTFNRNTYAATVQTTGTLSY
jgi:hypothetical protein